MSQNIFGLAGPPAAHADGGRTPYRTASFKVFISYSRRDKKFADRLYAALAESGREPWMDTEKILPTEDWLRALKLAIEAADAFVFVISPDSLGSDICLLELAHAEASGKRLVFVLHRAPAGATVPHTIGAPNWVDFSGARNFSGALATLISALDIDLRYTHQHTNLLRHASEWKDTSFDESLLMRGSKLREAEEWLAEAHTGKEPRLTPLLSDYVRRSREAEVAAARRRRRTRWAAAGVAAALLAFIAVLGYVSYTRGRAARAQALAEAARRLLAADSEAALLLAADAVETSPTVEAVEMLREALKHSHGRAVLRGHAKAVRVIEFSPDSSRLVTADEGGAVRVWEVGTGRLLSEPRGHAGAVLCAGFSPDGARVLTGGADGAARVWEVEGGALVRELPHGAAVRAAAFNPRDAALVLTAGDDHAARLWNLAADGAPLVLGEHTRPVTAASFSPDGGLIVTASDDTTARLWARAGGGGWGRRHLLEHSSPVKGAAFSPDGKFLLTASELDRRAALWDAQTGARLAGEFYAETPHVTPASFKSAGSSALVTTGAESKALIYSRSNTMRLDVNTSGSETFSVRAQLGLHGGRVTSACFVGLGNRSVVTASTDNRVRLWNVASSEYELTNRNPEPTLIRGHAGEVTLLRCSPDGRWFVTGGGDGLARVWRGVTNAEGGRDGYLPLVGHGGRVSAVEFSRDGQLVVIGSGDGRATVWDVAAGDPKLWAGTFAQVGRAYPPHIEPGPVLDAAFSPDGNWIATLAALDPTVLVANYRTGTLVEPLTAELATERADELLGDRLGFRGSRALLKGVAFSADGKRLYLFANDRTQVFDATRLAEKQAEYLDTLEGDGGPAGKQLVADDGRLVYAVRDHNVVVTGAAAGKCGGVLTGHRDALTDLTFSPGQKFLATSSRDGVTMVWDIHSAPTACRKLATLVGHQGAVWGASVSPDGRWAATASDDGAAAIWDVEEAKVRFRLGGHGGAVSDVAFSPDGLLVVTACADGYVRVWDAATGARLKELREKGAVGSVTFSRDGSYLATTSDSEEARVYSQELFALPAGLLAAARARLTFELGAEEEARYLN